MNFILRGPSLHGKPPAAHSGHLLSNPGHLIALDNWPCAVHFMSKGTAADKELIHDSSQVGVGCVLVFPSLFAWNAWVSQLRLSNENSSGVLSTSCQSLHRCFQLCSTWRQACSQTGCSDMMASSTNPSVWIGGLAPNSKQVQKTPGGP